MDNVKLGLRKWARREPRNRLIAVIDIGSNSVRMVVYKGLRRNPNILFNERVLCGLGKHVATTGKMGENEMICALSTLKRFSLLCMDMKIDVIEAFATSAVRDAKNGKEFISLILHSCGFKVNILSGSEEARCSALGVISAFPKATGIVGDLGGGSLELIYIENDEILDRVTLPLGPVSLLGNEKKLSPQKKQYILDKLNQVPWLSNGKDKSFFMVGGAWRTLARLFQSEENYPLKVLQGYTVNAHDMVRFCEKTSKKDPSKLEKVAQISKRRIPLVPTAATVLKAVLDKTQSGVVISSDNGIREGILYKMLNHSLRKQDPFVAACKDIADQTGRFPEHGDKLMNWMDPIFSNQDDEDKRLRLCICMLSDTGWTGHPDYRAERVFEEIFHGRFTGLDHRGRAMVAYAIYINYGGPAMDPFVKGARAILNKNDIHIATIMGLALRLGQRLTGGTSHPLDYTRLEIEGDILALKIPAQYFDLGGSVVMSRLKDLAKLLDLTPKIVRVK